MTDGNKKYPLKLYVPDWESPLTRTIIDLEHLRKKEWGGTTPPYIFFQLKDIFQKLESLGSARIEGNRTTLSNLVEEIIESEGGPKEERIREITNIDETIDFIEGEIAAGKRIRRQHLSEIHKRIVKDLPPPPRGEGSKNPGKYRTTNVDIQGSEHTPPEALQVAPHMNELLDFINKGVESQLDLLIVAISHHRMAWIYPFDNGNGRVVRLLTYAMLLQKGFLVRGGFLNPTAVFCIDREKYYDMLSLADSGSRQDILSWCDYLLGGLKREIEKVGRLAEKDYLNKNILDPALDFSLEREMITKEEHDILKKILEKPKMVIKSADIEEVTGEESPVQRSRMINDLKEKRLIRPISEKKRIYTIDFSSGYLLRGVAKILEEENFVPSSLNEDKS